MRQAFVAMSTVLIISGVGLAIVATSLFLSIGVEQSALSFQLGEANLVQVEGCVEDLIENVRDNPAFAVTSITRPEGTCNLSYNTSGPINWDVTVSLTQGDYTRKNRVVFVRNPTGMAITSWQEI